MRPGLAVARYKGVMIAITSPEAVGLRSRHGGPA